MKKYLSLVLALVMVLFAFASCTEKAPETDNTSAPVGDITTAAAPENTEGTTEAPAADIFAKSEGTMTYAEYAAAKKGDTVVIEGFIQAKGDTYASYKNSNVFLADKDGAYYVYRLTVKSDEDWAKMTVGTKLKVTGVKSDYSGEVEIAGDDQVTPATYEILEGSYVADPVDVTAKVGTADIETYMNQLITIKGAEVVADDNGKAFTYKYNGSGSQGDDAYFYVNINGAKYQFLAETDITNKDTDVYKAIEALKAGDKVDLVGFAYWYNGLQMQVTSLTAAK